MRARAKWKKITSSMFSFWEENEERSHLMFQDVWHPGKPPIHAELGKKASFRLSKLGPVQVLGVACQARWPGGGPQGEELEEEKIMEEQTALESSGSRAL